MKHKKLKLLIAFLFGFSITVLQAQEANLASGNNISGAGGSVSYAVGQVFYTSNSGSTGSVANGVQQPYEISVVTQIEKAKNIILEINAFPNPTTEFLTLKVDASTSLGNLNYQIYDIIGKLLISQKIENNESQISMKNYVSGNYFLKITDENSEIKTFKITKN